MGSAEELRRRAAIRPVKRRIEDDFLDRPGVIGVDIGEKVTGGRRTGKTAIVVYVRRKRPAAELPASLVLPTEVEGVPTDVVEDEVVLHPALLRVDAAPEQQAEVHRTLVGGIGMGPCRAIRLVPPEAPEPGEYVTVGTLGVLVVDRTDPRRVLGLTSFHVACVDDAWSIGDTMTHPSRVDGGRCRKNVFGMLDRAALSSAVDGAVIGLSRDVAYEGSIADIGKVTGQGEARLGMTVRKRGRTTRLTSGLITSIDATIKLDYGDSLGLRRLRDQLRVSGTAGRFGNLGDSGSVLVDADNRVVGLYFAGNADGSVGFANPIARVLDELDVNIWVR